MKATKIILNAYYRALCKFLNTPVEEKKINKQLYTLTIDISKIKECIEEELSKDIFKGDITAHICDDWEAGENDIAEIEYTALLDTIAEETCENSEFYSFVDSDVYYTLWDIVEDIVEKVLP
jgi:hypothetical protein